MDASPLLLIACDAGRNIGLGHLSRCAALASAWNARGGRTLLVAGRAETLEHAASFAEAFPDRVLLEASESRAAALGRLAGERDAALVVLDGYEYTALDQLAIVSTGRALLVVDDLASLPFYVADFIVNSNFGAGALVYPRGPLTVALQGERYLLLRREYAALGRAPADPGEAVDASSSGVESEHGEVRLVVTFGGADASNLTGRVVDALRDLQPTWRLDVVIGPANVHRAAIERAAAEWGERCELLVGVTDLADVFRRADLALSAGGGTMWELAAAGTPTVAVIVAENQRPGVERFAAAGAIAPGGELETLSLDTLKSLLLDLVRDGGRRRTMIRTAQSLVDGRGAERVVDMLAQHLPLLRPATRDDAPLLLDWANEPGVRGASFNPKEIAYDEHVAWLDRLLADLRAQIWIACDPNGEPVGCVRFEPTKTPCVEKPGDWSRPSTVNAVISVSVDAQRRRSGWGPRIIRAATLRFLHERPGCQRVVAYIRTENVPSQRAFVRAGYSFAVESSCQGLSALIYTFDRRDVAKLADLSQEAVS